MKSPRSGPAYMYIVSILLIGFPILISSVAANPMTIVPTSAMLAAGVSGFTHTALGSASKENQLTVEGGGDSLLKFFHGIGIKGRFSASVAVFFLSFFLFAGGQFEIYRRFETTEAKVKRLSPNPETNAIDLEHTWRKDSAPPENYYI